MFSQSYVQVSAGLTDIGGLTVAALKTNENNRVKNPNWREANQLAIHKDDRGVEPSFYPEQHQLVARAGFEPRSPGTNDYYKYTTRYHKRQTKDIQKSSLLLMIFFSIAGTKICSVNMPVIKLKFV